MCARVSILGTFVIAAVASTSESQAQWVWTSGPSVTLAYSFAVRGSTIFVGPAETVSFVHPIR